ncbi:MAG: hypothetical protein Q9216_003681 [Gyalolechia sp. 2 TL-2023]
MAEFAITAHITQIATIGSQLSVKLYTFGEILGRADGTVISISQDICLLSAVLEELGHQFEKDQEVQICSENAIKTAEEAVQECSAVFEEIGRILETNARLAMAKWASITVDELRWPFLQPMMQFLRSSLNKSKATLLLMLNVIIYARQIFEIGHQTSQLDHQRQLIEHLVRSECEYTRQFVVLRQAITDNASTGGTAGTHGFIPLHLSQDHPGLLPMSSDYDQSTRLWNELRDYSELINRLLQDVEETEQHIEPFLGAKIRSNIIITHRQEVMRLQSIHGIGQIKVTITGDAWDVLESGFEGELTPASLDAGQVQSRSDEVNCPQLTRPHYDHQWNPLVLSQASMRETEITNGLPVLPTVDTPFSQQVPLEYPSEPGCQWGMANSRKRPRSRTNSTSNISARETPRSIGRIPPMRRSRSASPTQECILDLSESNPDPASEGITERIDCGDSELEPQNFKVKEHDRWLPMTYIIKKMRQGLPDNTFITKEAKECMRECVSKFISFITSEAAKDCQVKKENTMVGEDVLLAMRSLGFENYAEALNVFLTRYRQTIPRENCHPCPSPPSHIMMAKIDGAANLPILAPHQPDEREADTISTTRTHIPSHEDHGNLSQSQADPSSPEEDGISEQDTTQEASSIVDHLLSQWTLLKKFGL